MAELADSRRVRVGLVVAAIVGVIVVVTLVVINRRGEGLDAFYQPPVPLVPRDHGTMIRHEPTTDGDAARLNARVERIMYHSRSVGDSDLAVTGWAAVPQGPVPEGGRPVLALGHPTVGIADGCTPSKGLTGIPVRIVDFALAQGWAVVSSDYQGLGPPGRHPYLVGVSEGRSVLDSVIALDELPGAEPSGEVMLWGHSQGGHAVLFAQREAAGYAGDLDVVGAVANAPVTDVGRTMRFVANNGTNNELLAYVIAGYSTAYERLEAADIFTEDALAVIRAVDEECVPAMNDLLGSDPFRADPTSTEPWAAYLARNDPGNEASDVPLLVTHGGNDRILPIAATEDMARQLCARGQPLELVTVPEANHATIIPTTREQAQAWLLRRLGGEEPTSTCGLRS